MFCKPVWSLKVPTCLSPAHNWSSVQVGVEVLMAKIQEKENSIRSTRGQEAGNQGLGRGQEGKN